MVNSRTVMSNAGTDGYGLDHTVFLQFSAGNDTDNGALSNRIMLKAEDVGISTSRQVPQIPIPFSGVPEKTGKPIIPSNKYKEIVATPNLHPKHAPINKITKVCIVIGTG